jgi:hypothetical protein
MPKNTEQNYKEKAEELCRDFKIKNKKAYTKTHYHLDPHSFHTMWTTYEVDVVCCKIISPSRNTLHST